MYKIIRQAITKDLADFCYNYLLLKRDVAKFLIHSKYMAPTTGLFGVWTCSQVPGTWSHYSDIAMETLLKKLQPLMETETKIKLYPTYSYTRIYKRGDILERHKDRYSCEVSTTLNLGGDPWPIFLEPSGKEGEQGISMLLEPGDMLLYDGTNQEHWREAFEGENCGQVFLHYNNASLDTASKNKYDTRPFLGLPEYFRGCGVADD